MLDGVASGDIAKIGNAAFQKKDTGEITMSTMVKKKEKTTIMTKMMKRKVVIRVMKKKLMTAGILIVQRHKHQNLT